MKALPEHIQENIDKDKDYYSLYSKEVILRCKEDELFLGDVIIANEKLIWHAIFKYVPQVVAPESYGATREDIFQLGVIGFMKSMKAFDVERGFSFPSFAITAIVREIKHYLRNNYGVIRLTRKAHDILVGVKRIESSLGYMPSHEVLADMLNTTTSLIECVLRAGQQMVHMEDDFPIGVTLSEIKDSSEHKSSSFQNRSNEVEDVCEDVSTRLYVDELLKSVKEKLSKKEQKILEAKLNGISQVEMAKKLNLSAMKVSRVVKKIMKVVKEVSMEQTSINDCSDDLKEIYKKYESE